MQARFWQWLQVFLLFLGVLLWFAQFMNAMLPDNGPLIIHSRHHALPAYRFPGGGRVLFPGHRLVALYGTPDTPALGALGEQDAGASVARVKQLAAAYQPLSPEPVVPTFEIIATVASAQPTNDNDYSEAIDPAKLQPWIELARQRGVYVVLDLQPGRSDFLTQARQYQSLLEQPNIGLALDPEWRLGPNQLPLRQIGSVDISEINQTADWLAQLTRAGHLPQKLFLLHQFQASMIPQRNALDMSHPELAYAVQMDGQGDQAAKTGTWQSITADAPASLRFGWKNFYDEDHPMLTPEQTMAISPQPWYISYQ